MAKRPNNEGSIYYWEEKKLWVARVSLPNGKRKTKYGKTQKEVKEWLRDQIQAVSDGVWVEKENITLSDFIDRYMADTAAHTLRPKTIESYESLIRVHIKPALGDFKLNALRPDQLQNLYSLKLNQGLSKRTVQYIHSILHKILDQAMKWSLVARNIADIVSPPSPVKKAPQALTPAQAKCLLDAVKDDRLFALYVLAITTGMREGELLGIRWEDIDFDHGVLHIRQAVQQLAGKGLVITEPKTEKSKRTIKLTTYAIEALQPHKENGLVFQTSNGTPFGPRNLIRHFRRMCLKAGLPQLPFHSLRHTFASLLLSQNVHPKVVQEMLGHSTITLTLDTYSHLLPDMQDGAAGKMNELIVGQ